MVLHMRRASLADLITIGRIGGAAFADDAIVRAIFPPHLTSTEQDATTSKAIWRRFRAALNIRDPNAAVWLAVEGASAEDGEIVGYAIWELPRSGPEPSDDDVKAAEAVAEQDVGLEVMGRTRKALDSEILVQIKHHLHKIPARIFGEHSKDEAYYLAFLAVDPNHHRKGVGRFLLRWGLDEAASEQRDCYLISTPAGVHLYQAHGFQNVGTTNLYGAPHQSMIIKNNPCWK